MITDTFNAAELFKLTQFISLRELVRERKDVQQLPPPWTKDPILQNYRFCNVRRMDDRVSQWLLNHWYSRFVKRPVYVQVTAALVARMINRVETLERIPASLIIDWHEEKAYALIRAIPSKSGAPIFGAAYIINGSNAASVPTKDKLGLVVRNITYIREMIHTRHIALNQLSMRCAHRMLAKQPGLGSFTAGQVVADLRWTPVLAKANDKQRFAPIGPGSRRGMNRLLGLPLKSSMAQVEFDHHMKQLRLALNANPSVSLIQQSRGLEGIDIQNCLCEFDKYRRTQMGQGKPKRLYDGRGEA